MDTQIYSREVPIVIQSPAQVDMIDTQTNQGETSSAQVEIASKAYSGNKRGWKAAKAVISPEEPILARQFELRASASKPTPEKKTTKKNKDHKKRK